MEPSYLLNLACLKRNNITDRQPEAASTTYSLLDLESRPPSHSICSDPASLGRLHLAISEMNSQHVLGYATHPSSLLTTSSNETVGSDVSRLCPCPSSLVDHHGWISPGPATVFRDHLTNACTVKSVSISACHLGRLCPIIDQRTLSSHRLRPHQAAASEDILTKNLHWRHS